MSYTRYCNLLGKKPELENDNEKVAKKLKVSVLQVVGWKHRRKVEGDCREMRYLNQELPSFPRFRRNASGDLKKGQIKKGTAKR
jgi:hypothetical protein